MFCKYCGKPVDETTMRCRVCGRPVGPLEGGNGFWDLAEEKPEPAAPQPTVDEAEIQELREQLRKLQERQERQEKREAKPPRRRGSAAGAVAIVLALLALAAAVFGLYRLWLLEPRMQNAEDDLKRQEQSIAALARAGEETQTGQETGTVEPGLGGESKWIGLNDLDGIALYPRPNLFEGPKKGEGDERGQSIALGLPENGFEETPIFTSRFIGPPGTYRYFWVRVESIEETGETYFTPLREDEGYRFREPFPSDADQTFILSILGEVKEEHLGLYSFVVVDTQTRAAYVSGVVELYDRAERFAPVTAGDGNGN